MKVIWSVMVYEDTDAYDQESSSGRGATPEEALADLRRTLFEKSERRNALAAAAAELKA